MSTLPSSAPDALLLMTSSCPHCPAVLQALSALIKAGKIARLEAINLTLRPEVAAAYAVRTVPWVRIGLFELEGLRSQGELQRWAEGSGSATGMADYFNELLKNGASNKVLTLLTADATHFAALLQLLARPDTELHVRLGIGAVMEDLQGSDTLQREIQNLATLTRHPDARIRSDACHYLSLTRSPHALPAVRALLADADAQVRETAKDSLAALEAHE
jgi:thiol-disulfide isomerase/thioredoxin